MGTVVIDTWALSEHSVSQAHFGGNLVYRKNMVSEEVSPSFASAVELLDIQNIRFPAGEAETYLDITELVDGELSPSVINFMTWCAEHGYTASLVIKTTEPAPSSSQISTFVEKVMTQFGDQVAFFEIGNEYWNIAHPMSETEYGQVANTTIEAISNALNTVGNTHDPGILVQTASPSGAGSEFKEGGWLQRIDDANQQIIDQISNTNLSEIDGVIAHYYYTKSHTDNLQFSDTAEEVRWIDDKYDVWLEGVDQSLELHLTEWNVQLSNYSQLGLSAASVLLEQFEYMIAMGASSAFVWPVQHNTTNDLAGSGTVDVEYGDDGIVLNTALGAIFDMMSSSLVGTRLLEIDQIAVPDGLEVNAYQSSETTVLYISSRSYDLESIDFDISAGAADYDTVSVRVLGIDQDTSDGIHYDQRVGAFAAAESVTVYDQEYYYNEHDVNALITTYDSYEVDDVFTLDLQPFEVVEIIYSDPVKPFSSWKYDSIFALLEGDVTGSEGSEVISGASRKLGYMLSGAGGDDIISGKGGSDILQGGTGNDTLYAHVMSPIVDVPPNLFSSMNRPNPSSSSLEENWLDGGAGQDILVGHDESVDYFVFKSNEISNAEIVNDFLAGQDLIILEGDAFKTLDDINLSYDNGGNNIVISLTEMPSNSIEISNQSSEDFEMFVNADHILIA